MQFRTIEKSLKLYYLLSDDNLLFYRNTIDMLLLTDKLNLKRYVLHELKSYELLQKYILPLLIFLFLLSVLPLLLSLLLLSLSLNYYYCFHH